MNQCYQTVPSKLEKTQVMANDRLLADYIPETVLFTPENLKIMLRRHPCVYVKPDCGGGGRRVISVSIGDGYSIKYKKDKHDYLPFDNIISFISKLSRGDRFLIQQGIPLFTINNRPVDVRVSIQKPGGSWEITGIVAKKAAPNKVVTNRHSGGKGLPFALALRLGKIDADTVLLQELLFHIALRTAHTLAACYPGLRELGLDIGIDREANPWILEVNTKPQYGIFKHLRDKTMYLTIDRVHRRIIHSLDK